MNGRLWELFYRKVLSLTDYSDSNLQTYLRAVNLHHSVILFCGLSAANAHGLATHVSMCHNRQRQQPLQANVDLGKNNTVPSSSFKHHKSSLPNYEKRHFFRSKSTKEATRTLCSYETSGDTSHPGSDNQYISTSKSDGIQAFDLEEQPSVCSIEIQTDCTTHLSFPANYRA